MLDPHRIRVFRSVMASGSVQAAADNLGLTSSAVSQHLTALQRETGLTLFERAGRGIAPTAAARTLDRQSDELMVQLATLDHVVSDLKEGRSGRLTIGYFASAGANWMPRLVTALTAELPDLVLELVLTESGTRALPPDIDLVAEMPGEPTPPGLRRVHLRDDPFVALVNRHQLRTGESEVSLSDLRAEPWISNDDPASAGHRIVLAACAAAGFTPRFAVQAQDHYTAIAFVAAGIGVSVVHSLGASRLPPEVVAVPLRPPRPVRVISALVREVGPRNLAAERALELLTELSGDGAGAA